MFSSPVKTCTSGSIGRLKPPTEPDLPPFNLLRFAAVSLVAGGGSRELAPPYALPDRTEAFPKATCTGGLL